MLDVKTSIFAGTPMNAGVSKASRARTKVSRNEERSAGQSRGRVTLRNVTSPFPPQILEASSKRPSILDMGPESTRYDIEVNAKPVVHIIPQMLYMSSTGPLNPKVSLAKALTGPLIRPLFGLKR